MSGDELIRWQSPNPENGGKSAPRRIDGRAPSALERMTIRAMSGWLEPHPCIGARLLGTNQTFYACTPGEMQHIDSSLKFLQCLDRYFSETDQSDPIVKSLLVFFPDTIESEQAFFDKFWAFVQNTHDLDFLTHEWDQTVASDTSDPNFELSFRGRAVFPTTFHPHSPRSARRFMYPGWAHNLSSQFGALRTAGSFEDWQRKIRRADAAADPSGVANPLLADSGTASAAAQLAQLEADSYPFIKREPSDREQVKDALLARAHAEGAKDVVDYLNELP